MAKEGPGQLPTVHHPCQYRVACVHRQLVRIAGIEIVTNVVVAVTVLAVQHAGQWGYVAMNNMAKLPSELSVLISRARLKPRRGTGIVEY